MEEDQTLVTNTTLVVYSGGLGLPRLQFQFEPVKGEGHFGYIKHVSSRKYVQPMEGSIIPENDTDLVLHSEKHKACLFAFDEQHKRIIHKDSWKIWHPFCGWFNPEDNTACVLHSDKHDIAEFCMVNLRGEKISVYPNPELSGNWTRLQATTSPQDDISFELTYEIGEERTETATMHNAWNIPGSVAQELFSASARYSEFEEQANEQTWNAKVTMKRTIHISAGQTVATWQYEFGLSQYGDRYTYFSSIVQETDDPFYPPE